MCLLHFFFWKRTLFEDLSLKNLMILILCSYRLYFSNIYYWLDEEESWMKVIVNECFVVNEQMFHGEWKCTRSLSCVQLLVNSRYSFVKPHSVNFECTELSTVSLWLQVVHTIKALKTTFLCAFVLFMLALTKSKSNFGLFSTSQVSCLMVFFFDRKS